MGIARGTASVELNDRELARIGIEEQVFIAYGYQPVMISAGCIQKTSASCEEKAVYFQFRSLSEEVCSQTILQRLL